MRKTTGRFALIVLVVWLFMVLVAGCGNGKASTPGNQQATTEQNSSKDKGMVALAFRQLSATWSSGILKGAEDKLKELGYKTTVADANLNPDLQLQQIDTFVQQKVKGVIIVPQDPAAIIPGLEKIKNAGIPLYVVDTQPKGGKWDLFIAFDNVMGGIKAGEAMEKLLVDKYGPNPKGVVLEIMGDLRHIAAQERSQGFHQIMDKYKDIEIVKQPGDWVPDKAFQVTSDLLNKYKDRVIGITMASDCMAPGVISAIAKAGLEKPQSDPKHIVVTAIDGDPEALAMVKQGRIDAIALQPFNYYGSMAAEYLDKQIQGQKVEFKDGQVIEEKGAPWSPAKITYTENGPLMLLNSSIIPWDINIDDPNLWGNQVKAGK
jgi:ribose transport system substrate-binding protein